MRDVRNAARCLAPALVLGAGLALFGAHPGLADEPEDEAKQLIVMIRCKLGGVDTFGAGIVVGSRADRLYIATANHVVRKGLHEAEDLRVELRSLPGETVGANLLEHVDEDLDLAVLNLPGLSERHISIEDFRFDLTGDSEALERGDPVYHVGYPNGNKWRSNVSPDAVSEVLGTEVRFESYSVAPGSSGGGLFDERWTLVGLVRADQPPDAVAVRIDRVLERLKGWGYPVELTLSPRAGDASGTTTDPQIPANTVEGWAIIGFYQQGRFSDMVIELPGDAPAIGSSYRTVESFRMVAEKHEPGKAVITLGMVPVGSTVQVLDLEVEPGTDRRPVYARLRAVVEGVQREPAPPALPPSASSKALRPSSSASRQALRPPPTLVAPRPKSPDCGSTIRWTSSITFSWEPVEGASTYSVEVDCFGCAGSGRNWYSLQAGRPWHLRPGLGLRSPIYGSSVGSLVRETGGLALRWRAWAVDHAGREGAKSDWCQVGLFGIDPVR